jgi:ribosomal protein S2
MFTQTDPCTDHQPIKESAYMNIPTIAFTTSIPHIVTYPTTHPTAAIF